MNGAKKLNLILLPGLDGTRILFQPLVEQLKDIFQVTVLPYPTERPSSLSEMVAMVKEQLIIPEDTILLAEYFSGLVALTLLEQCSIPLRGVIFCAAFAESPRPFLLKLITMMPEPLLRFPWIPGIFCRMFCLGLSANPLQVRGLKGVISEVIKRQEQNGLATLAGTTINCCTYKLNSSVKKANRIIIKMSSENHPTLMANSKTPESAGAWQAFIIIICFWVSQKLTLNIILFLGGIIDELSSTSSSPETLEIEFQRINYLAHCVSYVIAALTVVTITKRFVGGDTFWSFPEGIGWSLGSRFQLFLASITGGLLAIGITLLSIAFPAENLVGVGGNFDRMVINAGDFRIMWAIMVIAFFPIFEEFLYRGVLFFLIEKSWGRQMAGITASILFFLQHFFKIINSFPVFVAITLLGILTLAFRLKTKSLGPGIALHMTYNSIIVLAFPLHNNI